MRRYNERVRVLFAVLAICVAFTSSAQVHDCACDPAKPETMAVRQCSLCGEAEKQAAGETYFFLKDANPHKPNRTLMLLRSHEYDGPLPLPKLTPKQRADFWAAAIERARSLWGDQWGLAVNGDEVRTQCHAHIHIGRMLQGVEYGEPLVVAGPAQIPTPGDGTGLWIHPVGRKLHVHTGEQRAETVLFR